MAKKRVRGKLKDKWKDKRWITVIAPRYFEHKPIAYIPITSEKYVLNKKVEISMFDIYKKEPQQHSINLQFQITGVTGNNASTILKGHEYSREYLRSLVRRGSSTLSFIHDYSTKDNHLVRIYFIAFAQGKLNSSKKHDIRLVVHNIFLEKCKSLTYSELSKEIVEEKLSSEIFNTIKKIRYLRNVAIHKTKLIKIPETIPDTTKEPLVVEEINNPEDTDISE